MLGIEWRQTVESIVVYQTPNVQKYISKTAVERLMTEKWLFLFSFDRYTYDVWICTDWNALEEIVNKNYYYFC